jgi:thiol-disulfide isomerase/thioredoxin
MMNNVAMVIITLLTASGCASSSTDSAEAITPANQVENSEVSDAPALYVNGITDSNKGLKKGAVSLKGTITGSLNGATMYLYETEGSENLLIDSCKVATGTFDFGTKDYEVGFYTLALNTLSNPASVILNPAEGAVEIQFKSGRLENGMSSVKSVENKAWLAYYAEEKVHRDKVRELSKNLGNQSVKAKFEKLIQEKKDEFQVRQGEFINQYPNTFFAKVVTWKQTKFGDNKSTYWDDLDFTDESLIHTPVVSDRIQDYMRTYSGGTESGFLNATDLIISKADQGNDRIKSFVILTLLEGFYSTGMDNMCLYIMDNYVYGENCGLEMDIASILQNRSSAVKNLQIGGVPPNFTVPKHDGGSLNLKSEVAKYEYTLLMFWASYCHKCEQEIPEIVQAYPVMHPKGFQVINISVDQTNPAWLGAVAANNMSWPNVSMLDGWKSPIARGYRVQSTPTYYLVDKNFKIVQKPERFREVMTFLGQNLK